MKTAFLVGNLFLVLSCSSFAGDAAPLDTARLLNRFSSDFSTSLDVTLNHVRIAKDYPANISNEVLCYRLGELGTSALAWNRVLRASGAQADAQAAAEEIFNFSYGAISFCESGFIAIPTPVGQASPYAVDFRNVANLQAHLKQISEKYQAFQKSFAPQRQN